MAGCKIARKIVLVVVCLSVAADAQTNRRLWVLQEPDKIVEYDPATFTAKRSHEVPTRVFQYPQDLQINNKGQMLFLPSLVREPDGLVHESTDRKFWFWNGTSGKELQRTVTNTKTPSGGNMMVVSAMPRCFLSVDGAHLLWFENRSETLQGADLGQEISVATTFRAWQTDLTGAQSTEVASYKFPSCECGTGVCSESCPQALFWPPEGGIDDFFTTTHWTEGQIGSSYHASFLYRRAGGKWSGDKLRRAIEVVLDSSGSAQGVNRIEAVRDGGCCGWANDSDDQTLMSRNGQSIIVFDEFKSYQNQDYDVSFFTSNGKLSPNSDWAAFTISATQEAGTGIRLSESGKANASELAEIQKALKGLPVVEVVHPESPAKPIATLLHATLVGWINDEEILVVENNLLVAFDVVSGKRRNSQIRVKLNYAFLR